MDDGGSLASIKSSSSSKTQTRLASEWALSIVASKLFLLFIKPVARFSLPRLEVSFVPSHEVDSSFVE